MIFVRDKGQMCNNILQYAHVYAWAKEHHRPCMSMRFAYKYPYFAISTTPHHNFAYYLAGKFMARWGIIPTVSYSGDIQPHPEKEAQILASRNVMVEGWSVRHYSLFLQHLADIRSLFSFKPAISQNIQKYLESTAPADTVRIGVHIRRGDYQTWCDGKFYFTDEEYIATIRRALQGLGFPHYIIYIYVATPSPIKTATVRLSSPGRYISPLAILAKTSVCSPNATTSLVPSAALPLWPPCMAKPASTGCTATKLQHPSPSSLSRCGCHNLIQFGRKRWKGEVSEK